MPAGNVSVPDTAAVEDMMEMRSGISRVFEEIVEQNKTTAGVPISPESSLRCAAVLACVRVLSESVASLPFSLYRRLPGGGKEIADDHPLHEVLSYQPNGWMTSFEWRELMQSHMLLWGNAYSEIRSNSRRGAVSELIPLHPSRMTVRRLENGRLRYYYQQPGQTAPDEYSQDQIFHLRWLSAEGVTGYVPTTLSRDAIALARATELHSSSYFGNGARPGAVIETDQPHKPEVLQRLRQSWEDMHRGPDRSHKTAVLPHGMHIKEFQSNNESDQLLQTRRYQAEQVAMAYRVPPHMIGDLTNVRYSTVEQSAIDFVTFSLIPHLRRWEMACRRDLVADDKNYFCQFDVTALMAGDYAARSQFLREMANLGALDVDEIRAAIGYNPLPDGLGKKRFVQVNMQLLEAFTAATPTGQAPAVPAAGPAEPQPEAVAGQADGGIAEGRAEEVLFRSTLRKLASVEVDGILERRNKPAKLQAWLEAHEQRMRSELVDTAQATGRNVEAFVVSWMNRTRDLLLECHRSGKQYESVTEGWFEQHFAEVSDGRDRN